jgi:hypothetical protein
MHWQPVWMAFTAFGVALTAARAIEGHLPTYSDGMLASTFFNRPQ